MKAYRAVIAGIAIIASLPSFAQEISFSKASDAGTDVPLYAVKKYDTEAELKEDIWKTGGELYIEDFPTVSRKAPKGYKPFYISMFCRHGARYVHDEGTYDKMRAFLQEAKDSSVLTEAGLSLLREYEGFYSKVAFRDGGLTKKGQAQLREIADEMYETFPEVFKGDTKAEVYSTNVQRVLMSMFSFMDELRLKDKSFSYDMDAGLNYLSFLQPDKSSAPGYVKGRPWPKEAVESQQAYFKEKVDADAFASRFFTDLSWVGRHWSPWGFEQTLINIIMDIPCLDGIEDPFTEMYYYEDLISVWESRNYGGYLWAGRSPLTDNKSSLASSSSLKEIIESADKDIASGLDLRLRFSHDSGLLPLLCFMRLDNFGIVSDNPSVVKDYWRSFDIPMASNLQLVFYRSKKTPDILVRPVYNGKDASLPFEPVEGPFYSWEAFKSWYLPLISDAEAYIDSLRK